MLDFATVLRSPTFKFLVGEHGECFNVPSMLAKGISTPLYTLMSGEMKEAKDGIAVLKEVESETFTAFCEYAYTGSYRAPEETEDFEPSLVEPKTDLEPEIPQETDLWASSSKPTKKDKIIYTRKGSTLEWSDQERSVETTYPMSSYATEEHSHHLWNNFCNLNYDRIPEEPGERLRISNRPTEIEFKPLLFHCKLYIFAQMYLMASLRQLTLCKLHAALKNFRLDLASSDEVLEVIEFAFTHTKRDNDRDEELRKLLVAYAASKTKILKQNMSFRTLLDAYGELGSDMVQVLG